MLHFQVNKRVPEEFALELNKASGERSFCDTQLGSLNVYIILDGISKSELKEIAEDVHVIYQDFGIPFLVFKYKNMSFDLPLFSKDGKKIGNALTIYFIELNGYMLKHMRLLGLDEKMTQTINAGIASILEMKKEDIFQFARKIYAQKSPEEMTRGGVRQIFKRI